MLTASKVTTLRLFELRYLIERLARIRDAARGAVFEPPHRFRVLPAQQHVQQDYDNNGDGSEPHIE